MKKIINFNNLNEMENEIFIFEDNKFKININGMGVVLNDIPKIVVDKGTETEAQIFYFNKGISEYVIFYSNNQSIIKCFEIQTGMRNSNTIINNIKGTLYIGENNLLVQLISFNKSLIKNLLLEDLTTILSKLPFTSNEIEWYQKNIDNLINQKTLQDTTINKTLRDTTKTNKVNSKKLNFPLEFEGKRYESLRSLARDYNIQDDTLRMRIKKGMSLEEALTTPVANVGKRITNLKNIELQNQISIGDEI